MLNRRFFLTLVKLCPCWRSSEIVGVLQLIMEGRKISLECRRKTFREMPNYTNKCYTSLNDKDTLLQERSQRENVQKGYTRRTCDIKEAKKE